MSNNRYCKAARPGCSGVTRLMIAFQGIPLNREPLTRAHECVSVYNVGYWNPLPRGKP
ncbi:unnamed protein product [Ectocarpus sp. CCAP 1310/34]|nr:unnamed protein product [Ectocarpus sp. CCAP 1310/34]